MLKRTLIRVMRWYVFLLILGACSPVYYSSTQSSSSQAKELQFSDRVYEKNIKTVKLTPTGNLPYSRYPTPVIPLDGSTTLRLEFDDLTDNNDYYMLRLKYVNSKWEESWVNSIDYLGEYNEFRINTYDLSLDTKVKYVHYEVELPNVKIPGNYIAIVYREGNEDDIILSKRFVVFSGDATVTGPDQLSGFSSLGGQRIDFNVFYRDLNVEDPYNQITATIRQNGRWDNSVHILKPTFVKEDQSKIEYKFFDNTNEFKPGNEFRYFDIRSIIAPGQFVKSIDRKTSPLKIGLQAEKPRTGLAYTYYRDLNGAFELVNFDARNSSYYSDYLDVGFELVMDKYDSTRSIYIFGELTNWQLLPEAKMAFDKTRGSYIGNLLLKQGWYNYKYIQESPGSNRNYLEGDYNDTENFYEVLVYYLPIGSREEHCVGYFQFGMNERIR